MPSRKFSDKCKERQVHRDNDSAYGDAQEEDHRGLHQAQQVSNRRVNFLFVEVGYFRKHRVEGAGLFADPDHLRHHYGKHAASLERLDECLTLFDPRANFVNGFRNNHVSSRASVISNDSRMGTPELSKVDRVRLNLATAILRMMDPGPGVSE